MIRSTKDARNQTAIALSRLETSEYDIASIDDELPEELYERTTNHERYDPFLDK